MLAGRLVWELWTRSSSSPSHSSELAWSTARTRAVSLWCYVAPLLSDLDLTVPFTLNSDAVIAMIYGTSAPGCTRDINVFKRTLFQALFLWKGWWLLETLMIMRARHLPLHLTWICSWLRLASTTPFELMNERIACDLCVISWKDSRFRRLEYTKYRSLNMRILIVRARRTIQRGKFQTISNLFFK